MTDPHHTATAASTSSSRPRRQRRRYIVAVATTALLTPLFVGASTPAATAVAAPPPVAGGYFKTLPVGSALPSEAQCAAAVRRSAWEPRPENTVANRTSVSVALPNSVDYKAVYNTNFLPRISGNFSGTTDEIIQWASCKWGISDEVIRAQAVNESTWRQAAEGDWTSTTAYCPADKQGTSPCPQSFGLLQVKARYNAGAYPAIQQSTSWHLDYALSKIRGCYEGWQNLGATYTSGDLWGCLGAWYSGRWKDTGALGYISHVQAWLDKKPWLGWADKSATLAPLPITSTAPSPATSASSPPIDSTPPTAVRNLRSTAKTSMSISLAWDPASDDVAVTRHELRRAKADGTGWTVLGSVTGITSTYDDRTAAPGTTYLYGVRTFDAAGNMSPASNILTAATLAVADTTAPSAPSGLRVTASTRSRVSLAWSAAKDDRAIVRYEVRRGNGTLSGWNVVGSISGSTLTFQDATVTRRTTYSYGVRAFDAAGNMSSASNIVLVSTPS